MMCGEKCPNCCYIGEGDFFCDYLQKIVVSDFCPTEYFANCGQHLEALKKEKLKQTEERLNYAINQFKKNNIKYAIKNESIGQIHAYRKFDDKLFVFYARTGKIQGNEEVRGISNLIKILLKTKKVNNEN